HQKPRQSQAGLVPLTQHIEYDGAERVEGKHVEEQVRPVGVQEAGGEEAIPLIAPPVHLVGVEYPVAQQFLVRPGVGRDGHCEAYQNKNRVEMHTLCGKL
nr:hypothetical protein [Tanacetum cinerariifolium]